MEKKPRDLKKMTLNKETLLLLEASELRRVNGGATRPAGGTCISCNENATAVCCQLT